MIQQTSEILDKLNITKTLYGQFEQDRDAAKVLSRTLISDALDRVHERGDRAMLGFVGLHFLLSLLLAIFYGKWGAVLSFGLPTAIVFYLCVLLYPRTLFTRIVAGVVLQMFFLLYLYQLNGLSEAKFFFFISFTILIVYQDWRVLLPGLVLFFGQILLFVYAQAFVQSFEVVGNDYLQYIRNLASADASGQINWQSLGFYFGIACLQVGLSGLWANYLRQQTMREILSQQRLLTKQIEVEQANSQLEERIRVKTQDLQEALEITQANEEELRQNMEELQATQDEIDQQRRRLMENQARMEQVERELRQRQAEMERQQWLESNLTRFDDLMRLHYDKSVEQFSDIIILHLAELVQATQAAFYVLDEAGQTLEMTGGYACTPKTVRKASFQAGDGLLGQIIKTKKTITIDQLTEDSAAIESALTRVHSRSLVIQPLLNNNQLQGVIEIALLNHLDALHLELIDRLAENIGAMLQSIRSIHRTQELLAQSQQMTEQLRQNARELEQTKQEFEAKALAFQRQFEALDRSMLVIETSPEGEILRVNDNFAALMQVAPIALVGKPLSVCLTEEYLLSSAYHQFEIQLRQQDYAEAEMHCQTPNQQSCWIRAHAYCVGEQRQRRLMYLAYDISLEKEQDRQILEQLKVLKENEEIMHQYLAVRQALQEENERKKLELQARINAINIATALLEIDENGIIQYANDKLLHIIRFALQDIQGQHHKSILKKRYANSPAYTELWAQLRQGNSVEGEFDFVCPQGEVVWLRGCYYPVMDERGRLQKVMLLATDMRYEMQQEEKIKAYLLDLEVAQTQFKDTVERLQQRVASLAEVVPALELDAQGNISFCSSALVQLLGLQATPEGEIDLSRIVELPIELAQLTQQREFVLRNAQQQALKVEIDFKPLSNGWFGIVQLPLAKPSKKQAQQPA